MCGSRGARACFSWGRTTGRAERSVSRLPDIRSAAPALLELGLLPVPGRCLSGYERVGQRLVGFAVKALFHGQM